MKRRGRRKMRWPNATKRTRGVGGLLIAGPMLMASQSAVAAHAVKDFVGIPIGSPSSTLSVDEATETFEMNDLVCFEEISEMNVNVRSSLWDGDDDDDDLSDEDDKEEGDGNNGHGNDEGGYDSSNPGNGTGTGGGSGNTDPDYTDEDNKSPNPTDGSWDANDPNGGTGDSGSDGSPDEEVPSDNGEPDELEWGVTPEGDPDMPNWEAPSNIDQGVAPSQESTSGRWKSMEDNTTVFPNPSDGEVTVMFESDMMETVSVELRDLSGALVERIEYAAQPGVNRVDLNQEKLSSGVYTVILTHKDGSSVVRKMTRR